MPLKSTLLLSTILLVICAAYSCARHPYYTTNKAYTKQTKLLAKQIQQDPVSKVNPPASQSYWIGTTNFNLRKPNIVVIHHTAQNTCDQTLKTFTLVRTQVSAHYVICRDGTVHQMLNDYLRAWHAGTGKWGSLNDVNSSSIGIELDNNGFEVFAEPQINSLVTLLDTLKRKYSIPTANFIGHADLAPTRKNDPNVFFPWQQLSKRGFGLWYDENPTDSVPANFSPLLALKIIGYDIKDTTAVIATFKRKYFGVEKTPPSFNENEMRLLYNVMKKAM